MYPDIFVKSFWATFKVQNLIFLSKFRNFKVFQNLLLAVSGPNLLLAMQGLLAAHYLAS
jgi:hypothetical protein